MSALQTLLVVLGLSVAGNAAFGWAWIDAREKAVTSTLQRDDAHAAATACSDATEDLREMADKRGAEAKNGPGGGAHRSNDTTTSGKHDPEHTGCGARRCVHGCAGARRCVVEGEGAAMRRCALLTALVGLSGVISAYGVTPIRTVKVPVPVECRVEMPARPAMPTEAPIPGVDPDRFAASAMAEIELREGEGELRAALGICAAWKRAH